MQRISTLGAARKWALLALTSFLNGACGEGPPGTTDTAPSERAAYLNDAGARRSALEASLVNPSNGYSELRLQHYATGADGDWERLPEWNPVVEQIGTAELAAPASNGTALGEAASALALPLDPVGVDDAELVALGKAAFERYPVQLAPYFDVALASAEAARSYGLWLDDVRGVGGLVRAQMADGTTSVALTCATCHAAPGPSGIENGLPNSALNLGAALVDSGIGAGTAGVAALEAWGPGRLDVTTSTGLEPARIPDLRPIRFLSYLQQDATLVARDVTALAIRVETLAITSSGQVLRPPRVVAWALAAYLETLADALPGETAARAGAPDGAALFDAQCSSCHQAPALTGTPVPLDVVGTDPTLGLSADRGTGAYRVPSLRGVGTRGPLLHDGSVASLDAFFDPSRPTAAFSGRLHGSGAVSGHVFGLDLAVEERAALLAYLHAL